MLFQNSFRQVIESGWQNPSCTADLSMLLLPGPFAINGIHKWIAGEKTQAKGSNESERWRKRVEAKRVRERMPKLPKETTQTDATETAK